MKIKADTLFSKARNLSIPVQPSHYHALLALTQDLQATSGQLAEIIANDYGLTLRLLITIYSAFFSLGRNDILSIRYMVVLLGMVNLREMVTKSSLLSTDKEELLKIYMGSGLLISFISHNLASLTELDNDKAKVCGLLQNIGEVACAASVPMIVKNSLLPDSFIINKKRFANMCSGYNPRRLGEQLIRHWNLPELIRMAVFPKHFDIQSLSADDRAIINLVTLLNELVKEALSRRASKARMGDIYSNIADLLQIKMQELDHQISKAIKKLELKSPTFHKHLCNIGLLERISTI